MNVSIPEHFIVRELLRALDQPENNHEYKRRDATRYAHTNEELLEHIADGIIPLLNSNNPLIFRYIETLYDINGIVSWNEKTYKTVINFDVLQKEFTKRKLPLYIYDSEVPADNEFMEFIK